MKAFHLIVAGLVAATVSLQAETYYFTPTGPTTLTTRNTYSTSSVGIDYFFELGTKTGDFGGSTELTSDSDSANIIAEYVKDGSAATPPWVVPAGDFSLNKTFTTFSNSQALWMNPNNPTTMQVYNGITADAWTYGSWEAVVTFQIDDVTLYDNFFLEGRTYADDEVTLTLNGHLISVPSQNTAWQFNPPPVSQVILDSSYLKSGSNTLVFTIANTNPGESDTGPSGLMAYGRIGAQSVPEPGTVGLIAIAVTGIMMSRRRR